MIRLVIADDHALIRESLSMNVAVEEDMEIVGTACDGVEAVELVE